MQGVITRFSAPNISTALTRDLNKKMDTCGSTPSLLNILVTLFHTALTFPNYVATLENSCPPPRSPSPDIISRSPSPGGSHRRKIDRKWDYTSAATAREETGFETIYEYIRRS